MDSDRFLGVIGILGVALWSHRRHIRTLAGERPAICKEDFIARMTGLDISPQAAASIWDFAASYYPGKITPYPDDRPISDLRIDPDDLEDFVAEWWTARGWKRPSPKNPVVLPNDPSLADFARWLDEAECRT